MDIFKRFFFTLNINLFYDFLHFRRKILGYIKSYIVIYFRCCSYDNITDTVENMSENWKVHFDGITTLVEHPTMMKPPGNSCCLFPQDY